MLVAEKTIDRSIERDSVITKTLDDYSASMGKATNNIDFSQRVTSEEEKAEQLKDKILESLKLND